MASPLSGILPLFHHHRQFLLTTHVNPDGDGLGSQVALAAWLSRAGKQVHIVNHSPTPAVYRFLDPGNAVLRYDPARHADMVRAAGVIVVMDTNSPDRLRSMKDAVLASPAVKVCIDHHLDPSPFADHYVIDDNATSTGEIVYRLLLELNGKDLDPVMAGALYTAVMTDTGSFRYPRVDAGTHRMVAHLIERGADPVRLYSEVYERWTPGRIHLLGAMLERLTVDAGGRLAWTSITRAMLQETGTAEEDTDNFTTYPMSIAGVEAGILFLEMPRGVKVSFRSRGEIPINELAKQFGGNGHKNAAGARIDEGTLEDVRRSVIAAAGEFLRNHA